MPLGSIIAITVGAGVSIGMELYLVLRKSNKK